MGPSIVLSSVTSMADEWNRNNLTSTFHTSSSSNDDDDDVEENHTQQINVGLRQGPSRSGNGSFSTRQVPRSAQSFAVALFHGQPEMDLELDRERAATYSHNTGIFPARFDNVAATATATASTRQTHRELSFSQLDFSLSPLYSTVNDGRYLPLLDDVAESRADNIEAKLNEGDDDRKPAAVASPQKDASQTTPQIELISPHRKSHSISSDPFHSTLVSTTVEPQEPVITRERFIDPTFSFGDEYDVQREFEDTLPSNSLPVWEAPVPSGPSSNVYRHSHFTPPHAEFTAPSHRTSYAAAAPVAFRIGAAYQDHNNDPSIQAIQKVVDSVAVTAKSRRMMSNRTTLPIAMNQLPQPLLPRNVVLSRREASVAELESAETDRARSAVHVWYKRFNELIDYCEMYGDCNVPQKFTPNAQLGIWVNKQRMEKKFLDENKRTSMTTLKVEALESIGFTWAKRKGDASWMYKYHELQRFLEQFGSCDVPTKYVPNPALGRWVSTQRSEYKIFMQTGGRSRHLTREKIDMLNAIGFKWEMIPSRLSHSSSHSNSTGSTDGGGGGGGGVGGSRNTNATSSQDSLFHSREV